jgi:hypothetical protein
VRLKSKFGSRRLKEHQQRLLNYWVGILKILLHRICQSYEIKDFKNIFSYDFRDSAKHDIQELVFQRADIHKQLQQVQEQLNSAGARNTPEAAVGGTPSVVPPDQQQGMDEGGQNG